LRFSIDAGVTGHCGGTPHSCGSEPAQFNILPDKSGVPAETMRWIFCSIKGRPLVLSRLSRKIIRPFAQTDNAQFRNAIPPTPAWHG